MLFSWMGISLLGWRTSSHWLLSGPMRQLYIAVLDACNDDLNVCHFNNEFMQVTIPKDIRMDIHDVMWEYVEPYTLNPKSIWQATLALARVPSTLISGITISETLPTRESTQNSTLLTLWPNHCRSWSTATLQTCCCMTRKSGAEGPTATLS